LAHLTAKGGGSGGGGASSSASGGGGEAHWTGLEKRAASLRTSLREDGYVQCPAPEHSNQAWQHALGGAVQIDPRLTPVPEAATPLAFNA